MAEAFDIERYIEGVRELMTAYNERRGDEIYDTLYELSYVPNEAVLRGNYERNAARYEALCDDPALPHYNELPVLLFPVSNAYSVLFDKEKQCFYTDGATGVYALLHALLFADETAVPQAVERFQRDVRDEHVHALARTIEEAICAQDFGAQMQRKAEAYHGLCPYGELYEIFHAERALAHADIENAIRYGEAAYHKRKMSMRTCGLLHRVYRQAGHLDRAMLFCVLSKGRDMVDFPQDPKERKKCLDALCIARTNTQFAPLITNTYLTTNEVDMDLRIELCEELPRFSETLPRYRTGIYNPYGLMYIKSSVLALMNAATERYNFIIFNDFIFDIMKADETDALRIEPAGNSVLLPIAAKEDRQDMAFQGADINRIMVLSRGEFNFYRIEEPVAILSEKPFLVGAPIVLQHSSKRKKFVLNILADGLSWPQMRREDYALVPHIMRFFEKGVIFDNQFSTAEYTYPALATIETGLYQHHTQIAKPGIPFALDASFVTISEQMKALGYYCTIIQGDGEGIYNGAMRGFDRLIVNHWMMRAADGVERTIRHLETFDECDNFLFMHFADTHPYNADVSTPTHAAAHLPLVDVLQDQDASASVFLKPNPLSQYVNRSEIQAADRQLGYLFDYITSHYKDDEYIVLLYSDHGASVYARSPYLLSEEQTGAALMARGAGVPSLGHVDELASSVDIYKILGKLAGYPIDASYLDGNLPEAFGGQRREYTVTNSIYPGQTYKICVRTGTHAFHLETKEATGEDGKISLADYTYHIHERNESYREVFDDALARYFLDIVWMYTEPFRR